MIFKCNIKVGFSTTAVYKILYPAANAGSAEKNTYNISRYRVQSRYYRDSHTDQGCTKRVQPGKLIDPNHQIF